MRRLIILFFLATQALLIAQNKYSFANIPPECLPDANSVIRLSETTFHITKADEAEVEENFVVTVLNKNGKDMGHWFEMEDEYSKVKQLKARLYDGSGEFVRENEKAEVQNYGSAQDYEFINAKVKVLEMEYNNFPYTVEFKVRKTIKGFFYIPEFVVQRLGQSLVTATYTLITPEDYAFHWKGLNTAIEAPVISVQGREKTSTWSFQNLPAKPDESFNPYFNDVYAKVVIAPENIQIDNYKGNFHDWKQVGQFFYELNRDRDNLSPEMQATVAKLTAGKTTTREKIAALYCYLQQNHRYVSIQIGIGGWQTLDAGFVEKKKYGDCKALSNYMKSLLKAAGIEAQTAVIYGDSDGAPDYFDDLPVPKFNHAILYVPGEDMWLECTSNTNPAGYLGEFTAGRPALLLTPGGGKLVRTPDLNAAENIQNSNTLIRLDESGHANVHNLMKAMGELQEDYRFAVAQKSQADLEKDFIDDAGFTVIKLDKLTISVSPSMPEANIEYALETGNFASRSGKRMFVPLNKVDPFKRALPAKDKRVLDLKMRSSYTLMDTVTLQFPAGYIAENMPQAKKMSSEFGQYEMQITETPGQVQVIRRIMLPPVSVPAERYKEARQFYQDVAKADSAQMVLIKN